MNIKKILAVSFAAIAVLAPAYAKQLKVLMIGNSFSVCVLKHMPQCAADAGEILDIASLYIGGCPLQKHSNNIKKADDSNFKPYSFSYNYASVNNAKDAPVSKLGKKTNIPQALQADKWDIVTIQQASPNSPFPETYEPYAEHVIATIRKLAPQAEIVIQQTWSYAPYASILKKWKMTSSTMYSAVEVAYAKLAERYKLRIIPTGYAIELYRKNLPVNYGALLDDAAIAAIKKPDLLNFGGDPVGASSWKKGRKGKKDSNSIKLRVDSKHLNREGEYLQACTWLATLYGYDAKKVKYAPEWLSAEKAALMRTCAVEAAKKYGTAISE
jgi:hypothetical protein